MTEQTWGQTNPNSITPQGQQPQTAPAQQAAPFGADEFFSKAGGGGGSSAPSFDFEGVGSGLAGTIISREVVAKTNPGVNPTQKLDKNGQPMWQLRVILGTNLRNWVGVKKLPTDGQQGQGPEGRGNPLPPEHDTGERAIYLWYTLRDAVQEAVARAGQRELVDGAVLGVKVTGTKPNPMGGNAIKEYGAVYYLPGDPQGQAILGAAAPVQQQPVQQAPVQQAPVQQFAQQQPVQQAPVQQAAPPQFGQQQAQAVPAQDPWATTAPAQGNTGPATAPPF